MYRTFVSGEGDLESQEDYWRNNALTRDFNFGSFSVLDSEKMQGIVDYLCKNRFPFAPGFLVANNLLRAHYDFRDVHLDVVGFADRTLLNICADEEGEQVLKGLDLAG